MEIDYETNVDGWLHQQTVTEIITLKISKFFKLLMGNPVEEFRTSLVLPAECEFRMKMHFLGKNNDVIDIYILSLRSVLVKYKVTHNADFIYEDNWNHNLRANEWKLLHTLFKCDAKKYVSKPFYLKLELTTEIEKPVLRVQPEVQLIEDFTSLLMNGLFSDVIMKSSDDVEYRVHKVVLASRSAVLRAHFEHNTKENTTNIIETALETEVLQEVLSFIYSARASRIHEMPDKLLAAANYYQISELKYQSEMALHKNLTIENAIDTQLADLYSANTLRKLTLVFIKDGRLEPITKTEAWKNLGSAELIKSIVDIMIDEIKIVHITSLKS